MKYEPGPNPKVLRMIFIIFVIAFVSLYAFSIYAEVNGVFR